MQRLVGREIVVPASIGNVGPGFDTLGLAVSLYLRVRVRAVVPDGRARLVCRFRGGAPAGANAIEQAYALGPWKRSRVPSLEVDVRSEIPQKAGLGSSAAAVIAGLRLRDLVDGRRPDNDLVAAALACEGHPDNAAAALFGGLTSSCVTPDGRVAVERWSWPPAWRLVVSTPGTRLSTADSRRALPGRVPLADAVFNLQRVSRLLAVVRRRDAAGLREALADRCHQPYREALVPQLRDLIELQHPAILGVCLSGAGPSVVTVAATRVPGVARAVADVYRRARVPCEVRTLTVHRGRS